MPTMPFRPIKAPKLKIVPNHNPNLRIISVALELDEEQWFDYPIVAFAVERATADTFYCDRPITIPDSIENETWAVWDKETGLVFAPNGSVWIGAIPLKEARENLAAAARRQAEHANAG